MKYLLAILIFFLVLFIYIHIQYHLKTNGDLEVYNIDNPSKDKFEEICDLRQPVLIKMELSDVLDNCNLATLNENYGAFDIKIRNNKEDEDNSEKHLPLLLNEAVNLFQNDNEKKLITENNEEFLLETGAIKHYKYNDIFLRPPMVSKCIYDFWSGSNGSITPLRYNNSYRNYLYVTSGKASIKLIPPNYTKYLNIKNDYENAEFRSSINPWDVDPRDKADFNKVKVLDLTLNDGELLYIPAYWLYSIKYEEICSISIFNYRTYMNTVAIVPDLLMQFLQKQNIERKIFTPIGEHTTGKID